MLHPDTLPLVRRPLPLCLLLLATACAGPPQPPADKAPLLSEPAPASTEPVSTGPITAAQVANATITGVFAAPFTFVDGSYEGEPAAPGSDSRAMAVLMTPLVTLGEFDDLPGTDAAALVASNEGGSGEHITLSIVGLRDGKAVSLATTTVGDRTKVRDLRVSGRDVVLDVVEIGPGEAACCGRQVATRTYRLEGGAMKEVAAQITGTLSLATTVAGHDWTAVAFDGAPIAASAPAPTLTFADGRISGSSGCNQYRGPLTEPEPGTLKVGPTMSTRRACVGEGSEIETRFLKTLAKVTSYTFLAGRLVLSGLDGEQMRSITFDRNAPSAP